jgi:hypothetical protein
MMVLPPAEQQSVCIAAILSSTIQTVLSAPELHRFSPDISGVADFNRRSGISPCPEESYFIVAANVNDFINT